MPGLIVMFFATVFDIKVIRGFDVLVATEVIFLVLLFGLLIPVVGIVSQVYRYRRAASSIERAQTRLVVWALTIGFSLGLLAIALGMVATLFSGAVFSRPSSEVLEQIVLRLSPPLFVILPIALLIAIARHNLFGIEIVVDRTLVYGPLTAILALTFLGSLWLLQQVLHGFIGGPAELAIAGAAFVNAMLFQPLRRRLQTFIDRRIFGERSSSPVRAAAPAEARVRGG